MMTRGKNRLAARKSVQTNSNKVGSKRSGSTRPSVSVASKRAKRGLLPPNGPIQESLPGDGLHPIELERQLLVANSSTPVSRLEQTRPPTTSSLSIPELTKMVSAAVIRRG